MITDLSLIKACLSKANYELIMPHIDKSSITVETNKLLGELNKLFDKGLENIPVANLAEVWAKVMDKEQQQALPIIINNIEHTPDALVNDIVTHYATMSLIDNLTSISRQSYDMPKLRELFDTFQKRVDSTHDWDIAPNDPMQIFKAVTTDGVRWRLRLLNDNIGPLRKGDFGIIAAYVDTGKTSFICSELTHIAFQLEPGQTAIYFNNEGSGDRIQRRLWSTALDVPVRDILNDIPYYEHLYTEAIGGIDRIKVINAAGKHIKDIEKLCKDLNPGFIVFDQLDHIAGFEKRASGASYERYKYLYQWARELASQYCPIWAVSQCDRSVMKGSVDEDPRGQQYIGMHQLDGSKIGKQSAADYIVTIGSDLVHENIRYLNIPKNKLHGKKGRGPVNFNPPTGRYSNPTGIM